MRSQNSQGNLCRVTTDGNYLRYPREALYLHTFVPSIRLGCMMYKTKIKDRLKRARVRTDPTTHHIPILNFPGETRKTVGLVNPTPGKKKTNKICNGFQLLLVCQQSYHPHFPEEKNLNNENKINTTAPEQKPNSKLNFS